MFVSIVITVLYVCMSNSNKMHNVRSIASAFFLLLFIFTFRSVHNGKDTKLNDENELYKTFVMVKDLKFYVLIYLFVLYHKFVKFKKCSHGIYPINTYIKLCGEVCVC